MSRLIESIRIIDGRFCNLYYHEQRMKRSLQTLYGQDDPIELGKWLTTTPFPQKGLYKCRILYDRDSREVSYSPYEPKEIRRLKVVHDDNISYEYKFENRQPLNRLFGLRGDCDDVLIIRKDYVTDSSFSNIVFRKGQEWFTPDAPLLEGTMRQYLIDKKKIRTEEIRKEDIRSFQTFKLINAMLEFDSPEIEVSEIVF